MFAKFTSASNAGYKDKFREIAAAIRDPANDIHKQLQAFLTPASLVEMTAKEMASAEYKVLMRSRFCVHALVTLTHVSWALRTHCVLGFSILSFRFFFRWRA